MARKQRVDAVLPVAGLDAVEVCRQALLDRGCEMFVVTQAHIKGRVPGTLLRKYVMYELELEPMEGGGTMVRIATWTSNLFSTANDLVGRAARELQQTLIYEADRHA